MGVEKLKQLLGTEVVLEGPVTFRPSGDALRIEVESASPAASGDVIWAQLPKVEPTSSPPSALCPAGRTRRLLRQVAGGRDGPAAGGGHERSFVKLEGERLVLDTNILVHWLRGNEAGIKLKADYDLGGRRPRPIIPLVVKAEIKSLALQFGWGNDKQKALDGLLRELPVADISSEP